ncbi:hypothetical protein [Rickettsia felis]|nr:hypothetical protein [Rickettsia felis]
MVFRHCEKNYIVIRRSNLRNLLLFHEIATRSKIARNDVFSLIKSYRQLY